MALISRNLDNQFDNCKGKDYNFENSFPVVGKPSFDCNQQFVQFAC